jgi:hypothetical protein
MASAKDPRSTADYTNNHRGLVWPDCFDFSMTGEMSICPLVRLEDHRPFDWFVNIDLIERFSYAGRVFASDSKQNRVWTVRTNEYSAGFLVNIVESQSAKHCIH